MDTNLKTSKSINENETEIKMCYKCVNKMKI